MSSSERARHKFRSVSGLEGYIYTGAGPARVAVVEDVSARFRSVKVPGRRDRRSYARDIFVDVKHHLSRKTLHAFILFSSYGGHHSTIVYLKNESVGGVSEVLLQMYRGVEWVV